MNNNSFDTKKTQKNIKQNNNYYLPDNNYSVPSNNINLKNNEEKATSTYVGNVTYSAISSQETNTYNLNNLGWEISLDNLNWYNHDNLNWYNNTHNVPYDQSDIITTINVPYDQSDIITTIDNTNNNINEVNKHTQTKSPINTQQIFDLLDKIEKNILIDLNIFEEQPKQILIALSEINYFSKENQSIIINNMPVIVYINKSDNNYAIIIYEQLYNKFKNLLQESVEQHIDNININISILSPLQAASLKYTNIPDFPLASYPAIPINNLKQRRYTLIDKNIA